MDAIKSEQLAWFEQYDLIVCPASQRAPITLDYEPPGGIEAARTRGGGGYAAQYNTTGWPAGVVRAGTSTAEAGLPLGIQVVAAPWREDICLAVAAYLETRSGGWQRPPI